MEDELSRPGYRHYIEKRADGSVWRVEEHAYNVHGLLLHQYYKAWKIAHDRGLPLPPPPPPMPEEAGRDEAVVCVSRSESRLGVRWKEADGRVFESDESGMCTQSIHVVNASLIGRSEGAAAQRVDRLTNEHREV